MTNIPEKVDVVIPVKTRDSLRKEFIDRIYEEIPVNRLIIIEGGALSEARKKAYGKVQTDWLVFLDDDVLVGKGWWKTMTSHIDDETGAIGGMIDQAHPQLGPYTETVWMFRNPRKLGNPGINNCLMRKEVLKGYNPPKIFLGRRSNIISICHQELEMEKSQSKWLPLHKDARYDSTRIHLPQTQTVSKKMDS